MNASSLFDTKTITDLIVALLGRHIPGDLEVTRRVREAEAVRHEQLLECVKDTEALAEDHLKKAGGCAEKQD